VNGLLDILELLDPDEGFGLNKHGFGMANEPRELALRNALYNCLKK